MNYAQVIRSLYACRWLLKINDTDQSKERQRDHEDNNNNNNNNDHDGDEHSEIPPKTRLLLFIICKMYVCSTHLDTSQKHNQRGGGLEAQLEQLRA